MYNSVRNFDFVKFQNLDAGLRFSQSIGFFFDGFLLPLKIKIEIAKSKTLNCIRYLKRIGTTYYCHCDDLVGL